MIEEVMKEENDYSPRRGWTLEEIATLSELKAAGTKIVKIAETLNRKNYNESLFDYLREFRYVINNAIKPILKTAFHVTKAFFSY